MKTWDTNLINVRVVNLSEEANLLGDSVKTVRHVTSDPQKHNIISQKSFDNSQ